MHWYSLPLVVTIRLLMKWWTYQKERFPIFANGLLVGAFSSCAVLYSSFLDEGSRPTAAMFMVAFLTSFIFFLQLRIADEFKDAEEDAAWRPYRPVPRGLISLRELGIVFVLGAGIQFSLGLWLAPQLILFLLITWAYLAFMSVEFFCREWLKVRPITYLLSHMLIMPLVDLYATATYWKPVLGSAPSGLLWFLAASFTNGLVIELGRKIRPPSDEEEGVPTYSKLWGPQKATLIWLACVLATLILASVAAVRTNAAPGTMIILGIAFLVILFSNKPGKRTETLSGLWTLILYLTLGLLPLLNQ